MLIAARNAMMAGKWLPYDAEVEYLETTGTQWIDTGVAPQYSGTTVFTFTQSYSAFSDTREVWGSNSGANQGADESHYYICGLDISSVQMQVGEIYHCETRVLPNGIVQGLINGEMFRNNQGSNPFTNPFYIFKLGGYTAMIIRYLRIHELKVVINSTLVRDFIPVRVGTTGAMYDRRGVGGMNPDGSARNDGMYFNRGTGAFVLGPDI